MVNRTMYDNNEKKVVTALSYMTEGAASPWSKDFMDHTQTLDPTTNANIALQTSYGYGTWADFITEFKLMNLRQGKRSLTKYIAEFNQLTLHAKVTNDINKCNYFIQGLPEEFADTLVLQGQCHFNDYNKLTDNCLQLTNDCARLEGIKQVQGFKNRHLNYNGNSSCPYYIPSYRPPQKDPNAMDIDTTDICPGKLSDQEREYLHNNNGCFHCRKLSHISKDC